MRPRDHDDVPLLRPPRERSRHPEAPPPRTERPADGRANPSRPDVARQTRGQSQPRGPSNGSPRPIRRSARVYRHEDGRRLFSAGHALVVSLLALVFGAVLAAPGMHKAAFNGQPGTKRDVSLAITGGLAGVSHALWLDRPRKLVQSAIGRDDADKIDAAVVVPATTATRKPGGSASGKPAATPTPTAPRKLAFTPEKKLRLWVAGDSLVITPGYSLLRAAEASPVIQSVGGVDGHVGTGLERPDLFNWFLEIEARVKELRPNVVLINFGGNDDHDYMTGLPEGVSIDGFGTPSWRREYGRRVGGVMDTIIRSGSVVIWLGLPITRSPDQTSRFDVINAIVAQEALKRPGKAFYLDTYRMFAGDDGGFTEYFANGDGTSTKVRADDGVHFDTAGGDLIARAVLKQLNETYDLTSWKTKRGQPASR